MSDITEKDTITAGEEGIDSPPPALPMIHNQRLPLWISLIVIATVSFVTRVLKINYSDGGTPVFDEKHYAPQAYQMLMNGGLEDNPGYGLIVHPPMGKMMIALGELIFGYTPLGWRIIAIASTVIIVTTLAAIIWRLTHSLTAVIVTGVIANTEGILLVTSRIGMLDIFLAMCVILGFFCIVMDITRDRTGVSWFHRFWLLGSGLFFGLGMSVKMSGVFYPALAGIVMVFTVMIVSKNVRTTMTATLAGLVYYFLVPVIVFALSFTPWIAAENSVSRHADSNFLSSFISYQFGVGEFHTSLLTSEGHTHPWESKPWHWLIGMRPMLYFTNSVDGDTTEKIWLATNPSVWLLLVPVTLWLSYRFIRNKSMPHGLILAGIVVGIVPWMIFYDRTMYLFYTATLAPFLVLGIVMVLNDIVMFFKNRGRSEVTVSKWLYGGYSLLVIVTFVLASPWFYGFAVSDDIHDTLEFVEPVPSVTTSTDIE